MATKTPKTNKEKEQAQKSQPIEVTKIGKQFPVGTAVKFTYHRRNYGGKVLKQLVNSAIIAFDQRYLSQPLPTELKGKVVIAYKNLKVKEAKKASAKKTTAKKATKATKVSKKTTAKKATKPEK